MKNLIVSLGINEQGEKEFLDLTKACNVLVAGKTGSGKSAFLHKVINKLINEPKENLRLFLIDLKDTEFSI